MPARGFRSRSRVWTVTLFDTAGSGCVQHGLHTNMSRGVQGWRTHLWHARWSTPSDVP